MNSSYCAGATSARRRPQNSADVSGADTATLPVVAAAAAAVAAALDAGVATFAARVDAIIRFAA